MIFFDFYNLYKGFKMIEIVNEQEIKLQGDFITPEQFEEMFGISKSKQNRLRFRRNYTEKYSSKVPPLPYIRIGKKILYSVSSITEWFKKQEIK